MEAKSKHSRTSKEKVKGQGGTSMWTLGYIPVPWGMGFPNETFEKEFGGYYRVIAVYCWGQQPSEKWPPLHVGKFLHRAHIVKGKAMATV